VSDDANSRRDRPELAAVSIEQLLEAERAAECLLAEAKRKGKERVEEAYKEAQSIEHRCSQRIEALNRSSKITNDRLVEDIEAAARSFDTKSVDIDHMREVLRQAASRLAARLTGGEQ
jgi:cell division septum initiation protein DivIVA